MEETNKLGNIKIAENYATFSVNPKIYSLDVVHRAAYIMMDKAFIIIEGDPEEQITIEIKKKKQNLELKEIVREFNEELLNYAVYKEQSEKNKVLREIILQRILLTNDPEYMAAVKKITSPKKIEDTEGIFKSWEEKESSTEEPKHPCSKTQ